ncbi:MAG: hypothetical protein HY840_13975, partial [Bacteroidetes bacterium]|nr:hypothetical protein [Bacteroidota bacterium]
SPLKPCVIPASGIALFNCMNGIIRTNIIGTDAAFAAGLEIRDWGITLNESINCIIGGPSVDDGNIIAYCIAGINHPSGCMQYKKNRFIGNGKAFASITNRCSEYLLSIPQLFDIYTSAGYAGGYAHPGSSIDIFGSTGWPNANEYLTTAVANSAGDWSANVSAQYPFLTGIETDIYSCSSILSSPIGQTTPVVPGSTCAAAIEDTVNNTIIYKTFTMSDSIVWIKFKTDTNFVRIQISDPLVILDSIFLQTGICGTQSILKTIEKNSIEEPGDTLAFVIENLLQNTDYFIKIKGHTNSQFKLSLSNMPLQPNPPWPGFSCSGCSYSNYIYNGNFSINSQTFTTGYTWITVSDTYEQITTGDNNIFIHDNIPPVYEVWNAVSPDNSNFLICDCHGTDNIWCNSINGILPQTNYYFSFLAKNLDNEDHWSIYGQGYDWQIPQIQVTFNGNPISLNSNLGLINSIALPRTNIPNQWVMICGIWNSGTFSGNLSFCIKNNSSSISCGNNIGIDNIQFGAGIPYTAYSSYDKCLNEPFELCALYDIPGLQWSNGSTDYCIYLANTTLGSFDYSVTGPDENGCLYTVSYTVNVFPPPNVTTNTPPPVCSGDNVTLTATATGGNQPYTYTWSSNPPGFSSSASNPTVSPTVTTTYTVTVSDYLGCNASAQVQVIVNPNPVVTLSASPIQFCSNQGISTISASVSPNTQNYSYDWSNGTTTYTPTTSILTGLLPCDPPSNNPCVFPYWVTVTDANGCHAGASTTVTVYQNPTVTFTNQSVCSNESPVVLNGSPNSPGTGVYTCPTCPLGTISGNTFNPAGLQGSYPVTYTYTENGCSGSANATIIVHASPTISMNYSANHTPPCAGDAVSFYFISSGNIQHFWWNGVEDPSFPFMITVYPTSTATYTATVDNTWGCMASTSATVPVNQPPATPQFTVSGQCIATNGNPVHCVLNPILGVTIDWNFGDGTTASD